MVGSTPIITDTIIVKELIPWKSEKNRKLWEDDKYLYHPRMSATEENEKNIYQLLFHLDVGFCVTQMVAK